ncbi:MAG TPA: hypothetical protein VGU68_18125 [Ktedonobacteraceae bacterium]|nr:hypothetical protein [Ktedonobacteraceae bacterium]
MMNAIETARNNTDVSLSPVPCMLDTQESTLLPSPHDLDGRVLLCIGGNAVCIVSPVIMDGYLAARKAYTYMEEQDDYGPYLLLTGYEYAHLTRQYRPLNLSPLEKREWQRGFIAGWNACSFGF